jgi:hypothetical protein
MQISASFHTIATTKPVSSSTESVTMAIMKFPVRRLIIAGGFAAAMAAAPAVAVVAMPAPDAAPLAQCAGGEEEDLYTGICVPHTVPNSGAPYQAAGALPSVGVPPAPRAFRAPATTPASASALPKRPSPKRRPWRRSRASAAARR